MKRLLSSALFVALMFGNSHGTRAQTEVTLIAPGGGVKTTCCAAKMKRLVKYNSMRRNCQIQVPPWRTLAMSCRRPN